MTKIFLLCFALLAVVWWAGRRFGRSLPGLSTYLETEEARSEQEAAELLRSNLHMPPAEALAPLLAVAGDLFPAGSSPVLRVIPPQRPPQGPSQGDAATEDGRRAILTLRRTDGTDEDGDEEERVVVIWHAGRWTLRGPDNRERAFSDLAAVANELENMLRQCAARLAAPTAAPLTASLEPSAPAEQSASRELAMTLSTELSPIVIIGGGLAGCECALTLAASGVPCTLYEQKPEAKSPAHESPLLGELVCSNSFRSDDAEASGVGLLKREMRDLGSAIMDAADHCAVPAGKALAVDRDKFAARVTRMVEESPQITLIRKKIPSLDAPELEGKTVAVAAGPLASDDLAASLMGAAGSDRLYFYDAIAPIISADSVDMSVAFFGSRYGNDGPPPPYSDEVATALPPVSKESGKEESAGEIPAEALSRGAYLNCPMTKPEYEAFYRALLEAEKVPAHEFEKEIHFEGCMPVEALAERGEKTLAFGPLKPVGFTDPRTGRRPWALLQLRAENAEGTAYNLVGCQTKMTYGAQAEVFRLIPGLEKAEFLRFGSMHRNTYVNAPECLNEDLSLKSRPNVFLAGQITGVEGYVESAACGLWLGLTLAARAQGRKLPDLPATTALGALLRHLRTPAKRFQPSNVHFGLFPDLAEKSKKKARKAVMAERGREDFRKWRKHAGV